MNVRRILLSLAVLVFAGSVIAGGTGAFFSDEERSEGNMFTAGAIDLTVDSVAHYNGMICFDSEYSDGHRWHPNSTVVWDDGLTPPAYRLADDIDSVGDLDAAITAFNTQNVALVPQAGDLCTGTWALRDLGDGQTGPATTFFSYADLKPGDHGENTISLHVENNDAWACVIVDNMVDYENGCTEPEGNADEYPDGELPDSTCSGTIGQPNDGEGEGELSSEVNFFAWADDGNNIWEDGELPLFDNVQGPANDVINGRVYDLFSPANGMGPMSASDTKYIGMYWCYGAIDVDLQNNTLSCDGSPVTNRTQTDALEADITFYVEQARNNPEFECPGPRVPVVQASGPFDGWSGGGDLIWQAEGRYGNNSAAAGDWELGVGNNTQISGSFESAQSDWTSGEAVPFSVTYDGNEATFTVDGQSATDIVGPTTATADLNIIAGKVSAGVGDSVELTNLVLNGIALAPSSLTDTDNANASYLLVTSEDLSGGFTLTGMVEFTFTSGTAGSRPAFQVQVRD